MTSEGQDIEADVADANRLGLVILDNGHHLGGALIAQDPSTVTAGNGNTMETKSIYDDASQERETNKTIAFAYIMQVTT